MCKFAELCGAQQDLCDRCTEPALAEKFPALMQSCNAWAKATGSGFDANPSPGNIIDQKSTRPKVGAALLDHLIEIASGRTTPAVVRLAQDDFMPRKMGVSL